jgi:hypothetical protein
LYQNFLFYWKRGELYQSTREGQEEQLSALSLVSNAIITWNTIYMEKALKLIENAGYSINEEDKARLVPFSHDHVIIVGNYSFDSANEILKGNLKTRLTNDSNIYGI